MIDIRTYYLVEIDRTSRPGGNKEMQWETYDQQRVTFKTEKEALNFVENNYATKNRVLIYRDTKQKQHEKIGYIYSSQTQDDSRTIYLRDWIVVSKVYERREYLFPRKL